MLVKFLKDTKGSTAVEYSLIATLVAVAAIAGITSLGGETINLYDSVSTDVIKASTDSKEL